MGKNAAVTKMIHSFVSSCVFGAITVTTATNCGGSQCKIHQLTKVACSHHIDGRANGGQSGKVNITPL